MKAILRTIFPTIARRGSAAVGRTWAPFETPRRGVSAHAAAAAGWIAAAGLWLLGWLAACDAQEASGPDLAPRVAANSGPFCIKTIDAENGWPVPLVSLTTTNRLSFVSDNAGVIAIDAPELIGKEVFFHVEGRGYEVARDGFGYRGVRLIPQRGMEAKVALTRTSIAKRLGRATGAGLYSHAQRCGKQRDWRDSGVFGADSVQMTAHDGKLFWLWGDTTLAHYPLGVFHSTAAVTTVKPLDDLEPPLRIRFQYFRDQRQRPRGVAEMPGKGPTWLSGVVSLPDGGGPARLVASYVKIKPPLSVYEQGLCVWNKASERFEPLKVTWTKTKDAPPPIAIPDGHAAFWTDEAGKRWVLFGNPFPKLRCPAEFHSWSNPAQWERLEPTPHLDSASDGKRVVPHSGSIAWSPYRRQWVAVFMERFGKPSAFGELWYAEAPLPTGPWGPAVKILSHDNYTFYNPRIHPELTRHDPAVLLFEGTYTAQFANDPPPTPRYDYNQLIYRLDLDDSALAPARVARQDAEP